MRIDPAPARLAAVGNNRIGQGDVGGGDVLITGSRKNPRNGFHVEPVIGGVLQPLDHRSGLGIGLAIGPPERCEAARGIKS